MNTGNKTIKITGDWKTQSEKLKNEFSKLTDSDLKYEPGKENELITNLEIRLNKDRKEVIELIKGGQDMI